MDTLLSVIQTLGVNQTIWIQFFISIIFLVVARILFINDLMRVLTERVLNTSGATNEADKLNAETENAKKRYEKLLNEKVLDVHNTYATSRKKIKDEIDVEFKSKEEKTIGNFKNQIALKQGEFAKSQAAVEANAAELSSELLTKIKQ
jgi:F0F1-type ATP synthase membrane subunit b/b'